MTIKVEWKDAGRSPQVAPNPDYPDGIDVVIDRDAKWHCIVKVPYPAKRIGAYILRCDICGTSAGVTTAGRPDDPRSVKIPCKRREDA